MAATLCIGCAAASYVSAGETKPPKPDTETPKPEVKTNDKKIDPNVPAPKDDKNPRSETKEDVTVRIRTDFDEKLDLWSARIELEYPAGGPEMESFESSAWLANNHCWLTTVDGKHRLDYNGGYELASQSEREPSTTVAQ